MSYGPSHVGGTDPLIQECTNFCIHSYKNLYGIIQRSIMVFIRYKDRILPKPRPKK